MPYRTLGRNLVGWLAIWLVLALPAAATNISDLKFSGTISEADQEYLGLEKPGPFTLQDIKAPYVVIEIMRTTCPHCLEQIPALNQLYHLVEKSALKHKVKFISVGETDDAGALKRFKASYKMPFPLVPDPGCAVGTAFNIQGTPTTVLVDRHGKVLMTEVGMFNSADQMFKRLTKKIK
jgi:peroxiredoxin